MCKGFLGLQLPCAIFYSRIDVHSGAIYSLTMIIFAMFRLRTEITNFIFFLSQDFRFNYEGEGNQLKVSQMLFNAWEFKIDNRIDQVSLQGATKLMIFTELAEQEIIKK